MRGTSYFTSEADTHVKGTDGLKDGETAIPSKPKFKKKNKDSQWVKKSHQIRPTPHKETGHLY